MRIKQHKQHPALILNERWDVVGWNRSASQVFTDYRTLSEWERNLVWILFTRPELRTQYTNWEYVGQQTLAHFRASSGKSTGESWWLLRRARLIQASSEFRVWWLQHEIGAVNLSQKELRHSRAGLLVLRPTTLVLADDPNLKVFLYTPVAQAETAEKLAWLCRTSHDRF
jgi:hypothetical protein